MTSSPRALIEASFARNHALVEASRVKLVAPICEAAECIAEALLAGRKVMVCGNGGSAADAQHFAAELVGRYAAARGALPAVALTTDSSILTALANDYAFDQVFSRQVEAIGKEGDVLVAISTSGRSANVLAATAAASKKGCRVIGLFGMGGPLAEHCDLAIAVPAAETARIQEIHILALHCICEVLDSCFATQGETEPP